MMDMQEFAKRYTEAWCSGEPERVAGFFAEDGSLRVNAGEAAVGRAAIAEVARGFMTTFPDLVVRMDGLTEEAGIFVYAWTLEGRHAGTGRRVCVSGAERWEMRDGLVGKSEGSFDAEAYQRQVGA